MQTLKHTRAFTRRRTLELLRQPWFVAVTLVQPVVWLLLFGALFRKVVEISGFHGGSYIGFLMPGVVVMTAFFSAGWTGMSLIEDINRASSTGCWPRPRGAPPSASAAWSRTRSRSSSRLLLPLTFLSATFMQRSLLLGWIQWVARFNAMNWAVDAARAAISSGADLSLVGSRIGFLAALSLACSALATRAFGVYQRSL